MIGADELVIGSFQIVGGNIRIDARFLDVETGRVHVFSGAYGELDKVFEVQDQIAASCLESLNFYLTNEERTLLAAKPTTSMDAYKLYSQAVDTYTPEGKALDDDQRITYLQQSTWIDPNFAMAYASLGDIYGAKKQDYIRAAAYYQKVVVLQPLNPAPRIWLTRIYRRQGNAVAAQQEDGRIKGIRQHFTPPRVHTIRPPGRVYINQMKSFPVNQGTRQYIPPRVNNVRPERPPIMQYRHYSPPTHRAPIGGQLRTGGRRGGGKR
jgi:tetratricopeptide (TPR) repeat protein